MPSYSIEALVLSIKFYSKDILKDLISSLLICLAFLVFHEVVLFKEAVLSIQLCAVKDSCSGNLVVPVAFGIVILVRVFLVPDVVLIAL